jgi:hypothetical protein
MRLKEDVVADIARLLDISVPVMSTGSTEPKAVFLAVNELLGLGLDPRLTKPELARAIVEASGGLWAPDCESRGGTVTMEGLERVLSAVIFFLA